MKTKDENRLAIPVVKKFEKRPRQVERKEAPEEVRQVVNSPSTIALAEQLLPLSNVTSWCDKKAKMKDAYTQTGDTEELNGPEKDGLNYRNNVRELRNNDRSRHQPRVMITQPDMYQHHWHLHPVRIVQPRIAAASETKLETANNFDNAFVYHKHRSVLCNIL